MVSIIIPTYNHLDDCLKPCIKSILQYTTDFECIIVANGCTDGTKEYINRLDDRFKVLWFDQPIGYTKATNEGIKAATGEYVILLNNDTVLLPQEKNKWVKYLIDPFKTADVAITGPMKAYSDEAKHWFIIFFCACIKRATFDLIGSLDEIFNPGFGEDVDFAVRCQKAGYNIVQVPDEKREFTDAEGKFMTGGFPIYHKGEATLEHLPECDKLLQKNRDILTEKYGKSEPTVVKTTLITQPTVMAEICTKGRYRTTLPLAIMGVINQTKKPEHLIVFDDGGHLDLREDPVYKHIFTLLSHKGISWQWIWAEGKGQVACHQQAINLCEKDLIWRVDDDDVPEPDVLEKLLKQMKPDVGAVGSRVLMPGQISSPAYLGGTDIRDIRSCLNLQWCDFQEPMEVDHLHNTFLFRKEAAKHGYPTNLSPVGHREETLFSYGIKRAGWKVLVEPNAITWHLRSPTGGIRSYNDNSMYDNDEKIFINQLTEWGIFLRETFLACLNSGMGDHYAFKIMLPEIKAKYPNRRIVLAVCYPEVFRDEENVKLISIADGTAMEPDQDRFNIYKWMWNHGWNKCITDAYRGMYL